MYPKPIQKLIDCFSKLPGVGPRAAGRFVFTLLREDPNFVKDFGAALTALPQTIIACSRCFRSIEKAHGEISEKQCSLCADGKRNPASVMVVEKEADMLTVEKSGKYQGLYHVLGGILSPLDKDSAKKLRIRELYDRIFADKGEHQSLEIILATNPTPEGDMTANYIERVLEPLGVAITRLGRGITAGSELEYLDDTTVMHALKNRK